MQKPTISIYGPFQALDSSGNRVDLASTKARHILTALILAHPEPVQRELLCRMIWPESSDDSRKTRLRQELAIIRDFATRIHCENMLVVQPGFLALSIDGFGVDCFESSKHYLAYSSTLPVDERIHNLTEQVKLMQRGQIAPDALTLFETERKRKESRLTTAQIDLTKLYIEVRRYPEARKVLDALLDMQPDNETAQALNKRLLEAEVEVPKVGRTEPPKRPDSPVAAKWKVPIAIALVSIATVVIVNRPSKVALGPSTPITLVKSPPISQIIAYQHTPAPDEFDESEFIGVARAPDGMTAVAGIVKTKTEDVDGLVTLLGPDLKPKWTRKFTSAGHDCDRLESVCFDGEKNVFAAGETYVVNQPNIK
ncbi:MAG: hypothetical protein RLZZ78_1904, partial [Armatimonadota bacterium]